MGYVEFKSKFINQFAQYENTKRKISLFKSALDRAVEQELPLRDSYQTFQIRDILLQTKLMDFFTLQINTYIGGMK